MPLDPKTCKNKVFFNGFEKAVFWSLKLLMALCVHLGCFLGKSGPKMGFQNGCQKCRGQVSKNDFDRFTTSNNNFFWFNLWFLFGLVLVPILEPILGSKIGSKFVNFWVQFWIPFLGVLELFGCLLGAFLGLLRLSWEASRVKKC